MLTLQPDAVWAGSETPAAEHAIEAMQQSAVTITLPRMQFRVTNSPPLRQPAGFLAPHIRSSSGGSVLFAHFLQSLHRFRMPRPFDAHLFRRAVEFGMEIVARLAAKLRRLHRNAVRVCPRVLPDAGYLPGDFDIRFVGLDGEGMVGNLRRNPSLRRLADASELIAEVAIERLKPVRQFDHCFAAGIGCDITVIDILHLRRFDGRVVEVFVGGIERVIYMHGSNGPNDTARDINLALETAGVARY